MALTMDPEIGRALDDMGKQVGPIKPAPVGDIANRRPVQEKIMRASFALQPRPAGVTTTDHTTVAEDGAEVALRWFAPADTDHDAKGTAAVLYLHGGGMISGSVDIFDPALARYVSASGVPILAVDYRLAPEHPFPAAVNDSYAGLLWLAEHANELGVDPARLAVMGDSAGGGLAAATALMARDRKTVALHQQILMYPMLDDRNTVPDKEIAPFAVWSYDDNLTAWRALLGDAAGGDDVSEYAAPARAADLAGLPPAYIEVGQLDIFRDEDVEYARRLSRAGVDVEVHVRPGVPHEFDTFGYAADVSRRSMADRLRVLKSL